MLARHLTLSPSHIAFRKHRNHGISLPIKTWIHNFVTIRQESWIVDGAKYPPVKVNLGVPQVKVLKPLLILINDLSNRVKSKDCLFADGCLLYQQINSKTCGTWSSTSQSAIVFCLLLNTGTFPHTCEWNWNIWLRHTILESHVCRSLMPSNYITRDHSRGWCCSPADMRSHDL